MLTQTSRSQIFANIGNKSQGSYKLTTPPSQSAMQSLLDQQIADLNDEQTAFIAPRLVPLRKMILHWEYGDSEPYEAWVFAEFGERNVGAAYCLGGHGALGSPWGLIFTNENWFGMDAGWYRSLSELIDDGWIGDWIRAGS